MLYWIKKHKFIILLAFVIAFFLSNSNRNPITLNPTVSYNSQSEEPQETFTTGLNIQNERSSISQIDYAPSAFDKVSSSSERVIIQNSSLSLLVVNVRNVGEKILTTTKSIGGFMVETNYSNPEEQGFATITVRVPTENLDKALDQFRSLAVKITSENLIGTDVTEQYEDLDERIATLTSTKAKFEEILNRASAIDDIIRLNQEIINIQQQIDFAKGQQMSLEDNARFTKITVFLSTDEFALPYTPDETFRPNVIFKKAIRSLLGTIQDLGEFSIWLGVYSIVLVPSIVLILLIRKRFKKRNIPSSPRENRLN
jgi:hypothetical protein